MSTNELNIKRLKEQDTTKNIPEQEAINNLKNLKEKKLKFKRIPSSIERLLSGIFCLVVLAYMAYSIVLLLNNMYPYMDGLLIVQLVGITMIVSGVVGLFILYQLSVFIYQNRKHIPKLPKIKTPNVISAWFIIAIILLTLVNQLLAMFFGIIVGLAFFKKEILEKKTEPKQEEPK